MLLGSGLLLLPFFLLRAEDWLFNFILFMASLDICIFLGIGTNVFLLSATAQGLSKLFLPCETGCLPHCTLMLWHGGCPNVNTGPCELPFCRQWFSVCHLHQG